MIMIADILNDPPILSDTLPTDIVGDSSTTVLSVFLQQAEGKQYHIWVVLTQ